MLRWLLLLFPILVLAGDANLTWTAPTTNTDGSQLEDLSGYRIYRNQDADPIASTIEPYYLDNGLSTGDYDWHVTAVNSEGVESDPSNVASKSIFDETGLPGKPIVYLAQGPPDSPMTTYVYIDFDNTDGGRDGSAEDPYNSFAEFQTARAATLTQPMHVYVTGDETGAFDLDDVGWGTSSSNTLTLDGQGTTTISSSGTYQKLLAIAIPYVAIEGFSISITSAHCNGIWIKSTSTFSQVSKNIVISNTNTAVDEYGIRVEADDNEVFNNLVEQQYWGLYLGGAADSHAYNNTVIDATYGLTINYSVSTVTAKNNIIQGSTTGYYENNGSGATTAANITEDATSPDGSDWYNIDLDFTAPGSGDYSLARSDYQAKYTGDDSVSSYFTTDLEGTTRVNYSVGAYEYEQEATAYVDFDEASNGDGSSGSPYNTFANFEIGEAATLAQAMLVYIAGDGTGAFALDSTSWGTSSSYTLTFDGQGTATIASTANWQTVLQVEIPYVIIRNLNFSIVHNDDTALNVSIDGNNLEVYNNTIICDSVTGGTGIYIRSTDQLVYNNLVKGIGIGIRGAYLASANREVYNNTVIDSTDHGIYDQGPTGVGTYKNNIIQGSTNDDFELGAYTVVSAANITSDATSPDGGVWINKTLDFAGVDDYHLDSSDTEATDTGEVLSAYFTDDLEGTTRSNWSVGAYEFVSGGITLVIQAPTHAHSVDNIDLTQAHTLAMQDSAHAHVADNVDLSQAHILALEDAAHTHAADNIDLIQAHVLAIQDALHAHTVDNIDLTQAHVLIVQDATHTHTVDNIDLITAGILGVNDSAHAHTADNIDLTQAHILVVADAAHGHTVGNIDLETGILLSVQDATHAVTVPNVDLTQAHVLVVDDALHTVLSDLIRLNYGEAVIIPAGRSIVFADMRHCMSFTDDSHSITVH